MTTQLAGPVDLSAAPRRSYVRGARGDGSKRGVCLPNLRSVRKFYLLRSIFTATQWILPATR